MMATTHVYAGVALVVPVAVVVPELAVPLAIGAICGGLAPDIDILLEHRKTLHFPVYGAGASVVALALAVAVPSPLTAAGAAFVAAAWLHAASDALGCGPEFDPWTDGSTEAVYNHAAGRWVRARRYVRYDGAPEDFALGLALVIPAVLVFEGLIQFVLVAGLLPALAYTVFRRQVAEWVPAWLE